MATVFSAVMEGGTPTSPMRRQRNEKFKVGLPWFNTALQQTSPGAADSYWQDPRDEWTQHRWESIASYSNAKSLALRREIADVEKDARHVAELSGAMGAWVKRGAPEARVFVQMYSRPEMDGHAGPVDSIEYQKRIVNEVSSAIHERRLRLEREHELLIKLPAMITERQVTEMPSIKILTPRHHTVWTQDELVTITWMFSGPMDQVRIKLATQFGAWETIADAVQNSGQFQWRVRSDIEPSKWYHLQLTGIRDGRDVTAATTPFFSLNAAKRNSPKSQAGQLSHVSPSPFQRHSTRQVVYASLNHSILLERFDPWGDADPCELLLDDLPILNRPPMTCCLDNRSAVDSILLPSGHGACFANGMTAINDPFFATEVTAVVKLYHSPDHLTGISPRKDPAVWQSLNTPGERLAPSPGRLSNCWRGVQLLNDAHKISPSSPQGGKQAADSLRMWSTPTLSSAPCPVNRITALSSRMASGDSLGAPRSWELN